MSEIRQDASESAPPEGAIKADAFVDLLKTLGMIVDANVELDKMKGRKRDLSDIMKEVLETAEKKLEDAKNKSVAE